MFYKNNRENENAKNINITNYINAALRIILT